MRSRFAGPVLASLTCVPVTPAVKSKLMAQRALEPAMPTDRAPFIPD